MASQFGQGLPVGLRPVIQAPARGRVPRRPRHSFQLRQRPFEITPFLLAPVLPGETLDNLLMQSRVVTDPIKNKLTGWWAEYFFFYVKHRDLNDRDILTSMMLDPSTDISSLTLDGGNTWTYCADDDIDWAQLCLERVVETWFRNEGEAWDDFTITAGRPAARIVGDSWLDSVVDRTTVLDPVDPVIDQTPTADIKASQIEAALRQYELLRDMNLVNIDYEDFLATYGIRVPSIEEHKPELIRYLRDWSYPTNAVDPTDGSVASAVSWAMQERADKKRFFKEPGFIFGVSVVRPKVFLSAQSGHAAGALKTAYTWLPALLADDPATSLTEIASGNGPLQGTTHNYVMDVRDLFIHGDQFVNFALTETDANLVALPNAALTNKLYPASADCDALFAAASPANQVRSDGVVSLSIAGRQVDYT